MEFQGKEILTRAVLDVMTRGLSAEMQLGELNRALKNYWRIWIFADGEPERGSQKSCSLHVLQGPIRDSRPPGFTRYFLGGIACGLASLGNFRDTRWQPSTSDKYVARR